MTIAQIIHYRNDTYDPGARADNGGGFGAVMREKREAWIEDWLCRRKRWAM